MCVANEILVATDEFGANQPDKIDATMSKQITPEAAGGSCMATCCKTYVSKGSDQLKADNVNKMY